MSRTLYSYWRSSAAYRVRLALAFKGLSYEQTPIDLRRDGQSSLGFKVMNPQGLVPYFIDGSAGMNQSVAIIEYLEETYPEPPLLPADPVRRAHVRAAALIVACDIHPINNQRVLKYLKHSLGHDQDAIDAWARYWIEIGLEPLEEIAEANRGDYLFGSEVTLADLCLVPQLYNARRVQADVARFPRLGEIDARINATAWGQAARPERQPDADA
jgi:maleylacetoacetate isomerase